MNIITALNKKYIPYTVVMLTSLAINQNEHIDAYLLNSELSNNDITEIISAMNIYDISIHSVKVDKNLFSDRLPRNDQWSLETYYRLMMLDLLPQNLDRAFYLDGDIIINKSLTNFYYTQFNKKEIIACDDRSGKNYPEAYGPKHNEMFREAYKCGYRYFNAGVMLLNIELMRTRYSFSTYLDAFEAWNYQMEAPDQDILNWVHWRNVAYEDFAIYDLFARVAHNVGLSLDEVREGCAIIHFAGEKPWDNDGFHFDIEQLWWDYAKKTPYYNSLLKSFVLSAFTDSTIELYFKEAMGSLTANKDMLKKIMDKITIIASKF